MKKNYKVAAAALVILIFLWFFLRFVIGGPEDDWICVDGQWVKHGVPRPPMPTGGCGDKIEVTATPTIVETFSVGEPVTIDFSSCQPIKQAIGVMFGSTTYEIIGKSGQFCLMNYGGEIENPEWSGVLTDECQIPQRLGKMTFKLTKYQVDFSSIQQYCSKK